MNVEKKPLEKSQIELNVELSVEEFKPFLEKGAARVSKDVKIEGFRPGKAPFDIVKRKVGEMTILEEAARLAVNDTLGTVIRDHVEGTPVGQPRVDITKLAPGNPVGYKVVLALLPEVTLGTYKDLGIRRKTVEVKDEEVDKMLGEFREMRVKEAVSLRPIKDGDKVLIDMQMFLDKVPVEGGQSADTAVIVGKDYIVPGFDKQLLGMAKGEIREFTLPYPKDFHMKNIAGKMVEFKVTVKDVFSRELPELNDEFAAGFGLKKMEELKDNLKKSLAKQKEQERDQAMEREMLDKIIDKSRFGDIPEMLVESESHNMIHELEHTVADQGGKFEDYLQSINKTRNQLTLDLLPEAVKRVKASLLIRELAIKEDIKVSDKEMEEQLEQLKKAYKDNPKMLEQSKSPEYRAYLRNALSSQKVVDKLKEWNVGK